MSCKKEIYESDFKNLQEFKEFTVHVETALKFDQNDIENEESIRLLLDRFNILSSKCEENKVRVDQTPSLFYQLILIQKHLRNNNMQTKKF